MRNNTLEVDSLSSFIIKVDGIEVTGSTGISGNAGASQGVKLICRQFITNLDEKMQDPEFLGDVSLILRPDIAFSPQEAYGLVRETLIERIPGRRL